MKEVFYYDIRDFITKLESSQFTFEDVVEATEKEFGQIETLKKNIIDANSEAEPATITHVIYQLDTYLDKLVQFQSELPVFLKPAEPNSEATNLVEKDAVLQRLKELFLLEQ